MDNDQDYEQERENLKDTAQTFVQDPEINITEQPTGALRGALEAFSVPLAIVLAGAFIGAGIYFGNVGKAPTTGRANIGSAPTAPTGKEDGGGTPAQPVDVSADDDPFLGNANAPVTIIEFSDFQCPFCRRSWADVLPQLKTKYIETGKVKFVYRDFPLPFHEGAKPAAEATECADDQGKFWEMHDAIFAEQNKQGSGTIQLTADDVKKWAATVSGLNVQQLVGCLDSGKYAAEVEKDSADGQAAGVSGTPTFFINGKILVGAQPFSAFEPMIEEALTKQ